MTRRAYPKEMVERAHALRAEGRSYGGIAYALWVEFKIEVGDSTVRDWVSYYSRGPA